MYVWVIMGQQLMVLPPQIPALSWFNVAKLGPRKNVPGIADVLHVCLHLP